MCKTYVFLSPHCWIFWCCSSSAAAAELWGAPKNNQKLPVVVNDGQQPQDYTCVKYKQIIISHIVPWPINNTLQREWVITPKEHKTVSVFEMVLFECCPEKIDIRQRDIPKSRLWIKYPSTPNMNRLFDGKGSTLFLLPLYPFWEFNGYALLFLTHHQQSAKFMQTPLLQKQQHHCGWTPLKIMVK